MTPVSAPLFLLELFAITHNYAWQTGIQNSWKNVPTPLKSPEFIDQKALPKKFNPLLTVVKF
ncbi:hypothetical protein AO387_24235 [Pseudomonas syringae ICMP 11168]|uniref:Uncharacterized protein n=1 Tax=Pseudomonas syringae pv. syringae TaxID=321 RepID=A0AAE5SBI5_PSESY|nr:hypothetical protein AO387_24235 [Pseudomonas syringae ICMP 11168]PBP56777.1 hypothetical protein CCL10_08060 [Pseudomonas syringae]POQ06479.1 hypothetical protein CXB42_03440 [Pseudomonas syringae pv. syringae]